MSGLADRHCDGQAHRAQFSIPQFEPLPPTSFMNRLINKILAPVYYLIFTIIMAIVVVPIYTVIENFKNGRNSKGGQRVHRNADPHRTQGSNKAKDFLRSYSDSYGTAKAHRQ